VRTQVGSDCRPALLNRFVDWQLLAVRVVHGEFIVHPLWKHKGEIVAAGELANDFISFIRWLSHRNEQAGIANMQ